MSEEPFLEWLKLGKIRIENGTIIFLDAHNILLPVRGLLWLMKILKEKIGEEECKKILENLGEFQINQALVRYSKILSIEKMEKYKWIKLGVQEIAKILGYGDFEVEHRLQEKIVIFKSKNQPIAIEYKLMFGKSEKPIDYYLSGIIKGFCISLLNIPLKCIETKCIACGDPYCQFEVFPAEEKKETKT
jgi:hypothetical protein